MPRDKRRVACGAGIWDKGDGVSPVPITLLPRLSILTSLVVATSVASGLAIGVLAGGMLVAAAKVRRR